ncbi:SRPBCC family protein [Streptomyces sp. CBMA152]|uniref:SRPBCC family protein n=1 Tax=Streptomyces sp. CBMA152 TaxID=1896312 RepID=UPI001660D852|nr:SRPBCC domain-containing protein [Streptomyces sp. CBMA152]MBD0746085.1 carbon monoxide dehydrogenase [Streptomyces sp. CBMA152]
MEHEVFVPVEAPSLRRTLRDPARVARCVPGLQQDAGEPPVAGRLRLRLDGHTITYRGTLRITELDPDAFGVEAEGTEVRGTGAAKLSLTLRLAPAPHGTTLTFTASATADGRAASAPSAAIQSSGARLLDRFAAALAADAEGPGEGASDGAEADEAASAETGPAEPEATDETGHVQGASVFDTAVPPPALDPLAEEDFDLPGDADYAPAEAAHARRTMIGRSAEEVDHAPPRGRYAPVPAPAGVGASATLRWVAPAAALALASAVVVGRVLRRRR